MAHNFIFFEKLLQMSHKDKLNPYQMLYNTVGNNFTSKPVETEEQKQEKKKIEIFKEIPI